MRVATRCRRRRTGPRRRRPCSTAPTATSIAPPRRRRAKRRRRSAERRAHPSMTIEPALEPHEALHARGDALRAQVDLTGALACYRQAGDLLDALTEPEKAAPPVLAARALTQQRLGELLIAQGDLAAALDALRAEIELRRRIAAADADDPHKRDAVARVAARVAEVLVLKSAIATIQGGGQAGAPARRRPGEASWTLSAVAGALEAQGNLGGALALYREGLAIRRRLAAQNPDNVAWALDVSWSLTGLAGALMTRRDLDGAVASFGEALAVRRALAARDPGNPQRQLDVSWSLMAVGDALVAKGDHSGALASFREALATRQALLAADADNDGLRCDAAASLTRIADVLAASGERAAAGAAYRDARALVRELVARAPERADWREDLSAIEACIAELVRAEEGGSPHLKHQLAAKMAALADALGVRDLRQAIELDLGHADDALLVEVGDALHVAARTVDGGPQRGHVAARRRRGLGAGCDESGAAARLEHRKGLHRHVAADRLEHGVDVLHELGEILRLVVDHLVGAEAAHVVEVRAAGGGDDARADVLGELDREARDAAGAALDQDGLAALQRERVLDREEGGEAGERERRGVDMRQRVGLLGDDGRLDGELFRIGAFLADVEHAEHRVAHLQIRARADRRDHAGEIPAEAERKRRLLVVAGAPLPVGAVDARGVHVDHDLAGLGHRIGQVAVLQDFGPAEFFDENGLHGVLPPRCEIFFRSEEHTSELQ